MENCQPPSESLPRRKFYAAAIYVLNALMGIAVTIPAIAYLLVPSRKRQQDQWVEAGDIATLAPNSPVEMSFRKSRVDGWRTISEKTTAWVVKKPDGGLVAFGPQCTHLGCAYHWDEKQNQFVCPCHTTLFSIDGKVISGPAPRPLDRYAIQLDGTKLKVGDLHHT
jgi:menaquinol-cytochrome c reductase iron-sulfur subunit